MQARAGAAGHHAVQQAVHHIGIALGNHAVRLGLAVGGEQHVARAVADALDQVGLGAVAFAGEDAIGGGQPQRRGGAGAQRHRQVAWQALLGEAELAGVVHRIGNADGLQGPDGRQVARLRQRLAHAHGAQEAAIVVARLPARRHIQRSVVDQRGGRHAALERGGIDERLEGRARLAQRLRGMVEAVGGKVRAADHGFDGARFAIQRDQRGLWRCLLAMALAVLVQARVHGLVSQALPDRRYRGVDVEAARIGGFAKAVVGELAGQFRHVLGVPVKAAVMRAGHLERFRAGRLVLLVRDHAERLHPPQHILLAQLGAREVDHGIHRRRRLGQARQHRGFRQRQRIQRLAEVRLRRAAEAIGMLAQVDLVHVQLEDAVFRQGAVDLPGQQDFIPFARERFLARQVEIARHLHGDGGGTLGVALADIGERGAEDAGDIHAGVLVELIVFRRQQGVGHLLGHALQRDEFAVLVAELANQHVVAGEYPQRQVGTIVPQRIDGGELTKAHHGGEPN